VRQRPTGSPAFRWEIYGDAKDKPVAASFNLFRSPEAAQAAGERALARLQAKNSPGLETNRGHADVN
jgi:hypothetical protein